MGKLDAVDKAFGNAEGWAAFKVKTEQEGIATHVFAALSPTLKGKGLNLQSSP